MGQAVEITVSDRQRGIPTKPTKPGLTERIEFEYRRHGTLCLIANFNAVLPKPFRWTYAGKPLVASV